MVLKHDAKQREMIKQAICENIFRVPKLCNLSAETIVSDGMFLAGDPGAAGLLAGLGLDELSMSVSNIPKVKDMVMNISYDNAMCMAQKVQKAGSSAEVSGILSDMITSPNVKGV
jgi:signal transduction protein with GAF and PtsI domain